MIFISEKNLLVELALLFQDQHMICLVDVPKIEEIGQTIEDSWKKVIINKLDELVTINSISGKCVFRVGFLMGFYFRPASPSAEQAFREKLLTMAERQTNAAEKIAKECDHGEDWKNKKD